MDNLDNKTLIQPGANDLQAQFDALQHLIVSVLILVVVISGTLNIYLLRQWRTASRDLAGIRPQAAQMIAEYQKVSAPLMTDFVKKVTEYGRTIRTLLRCWPSITSSRPEPPGSPDDLNLPARRAKKAGSPLRRNLFDAGLRRAPQERQNLDCGGHNSPQLAQFRCAAACRR